MGGLLYQLLQRYWPAATVRVYDSQLPAVSTHQSYAAVLDGADICLPCVPISQLLPLYEALAPVLSPETTLIDIASVKMLPLQWAQQALPAGQPLLMSHPLFGPDGTVGGTQMFGQRIMIENISAPAVVATAYEQFWQRMQVVVEPMTCEEHDRAIAWSLGLTHYVGRLAEELQVHLTRVDTPGFRKLCETFAHVQNDSWQLFHDMMTYNPYAVEMRQAFQQAVTRVEYRLQPPTA